VGRIVVFASVSAVVVSFAAYYPTLETSTPTSTNSPSGDAQRANVGPLDAYLDYGASSDHSSIPVDPMLRGEELVAECMAEKGFEYVPRRGTFAELAPGEPQWHTREYAERYGYGIFTQP